MIGVDRTSTAKVLSSSLLPVRCKVLECRRKVMPRIDGLLWGVESSSFGKERWRDVVH